MFLFETIQLIILYLLRHFFYTSFPNVPFSNVYKTLQNSKKKKMLVSYYANIIANPYNSLSCQNCEALNSHCHSVGLQCEVVAKDFLIFYYSKTRHISTLKWFEYYLPSKSGYDNEEHKSYIWSLYTHVLIIFWLQCSKESF